MTEIEKMFENANIKPKQEGYCDRDSDCPYPDIINSGCGDECPYWKYKDEANYPPFTAEKQLEIVKFMLHKGIYYDTDGDTYWFHYADDIENASYKPFEEAIAEFINGFWEFLITKERKQIKEILE